jgi:indolepyruvate ferredoxin oxidoreductase
VHALAPAQVIEFRRSPSLEEVIKRRVAFLTDYQNAAYAKQYSDFVAQVRVAEEKLVDTKTADAAGGKLRLTEAVARYLFKLMAYKDEYEVARLHSDPSFKAKIANMFEGDYQVKYHLAPPLLSPRDAQGHLVKQQYGSWVGKVFPLLAKLRFLRGSVLDPFGHTAERKGERALIGEYRDTLSRLLPSLTAERLSLMVELASIPEEIRGYGHVKERHLRNAKEKQAVLLAAWQSGATPSPLTGRHAA